MNHSFRQIYSVDALSNEIKKLLEMSYGDIWVEGEVSSLSTPASGHSYFTLKDAGSVLKCVLFKSKKYLSAALPAVGERMLIRGKVSVYTARGDVQLICSYMEAAGEGQLRQQFEMLKKQLTAEGLFAEQHKLTLPARPKRIALITSPGGAVLHDIIHTLQKRYPFVQLQVYPANVQGERAVADLMQALECAITDKPDLIILARGGGSLEDLQAFNDESLARALYACAIPTISAIGHETDFVISDFVCDQRAPTPTGAATLATPDISETRNTVSQLHQALENLMRMALDNRQQQLDFTAGQLRHPHDQLALQSGNLKQARLRLDAAQQQHLRQKQRHFEALSTRLATLAPDQQLNEQRYALAKLMDRFDHAINNKLINKQGRLNPCIAKLEALGPISTLGRGYSILQDNDGNVISHSDQLPAGSHFQARLLRGRIKAVVEKSLKSEV